MAWRNEPCGWHRYARKAFGRWRGRIRPQERITSSTTSKAGGKHQQQARRRHFCGGIHSGIAVCVFAMCHDLFRRFRRKKAVTYRSKVIRNENVRGLPHISPPHVTWTQSQKWRPRRHGAGGGRLWQWRDRERDFASPSFLKPYYRKCACGARRHLRRAVRLGGSARACPPCCPRPTSPARGREPGEGCRCSSTQRTPPPAPWPASCP